MPNSDNKKENFLIWMIPLTIFFYFWGTGNLWSAIGVSFSIYIVFKVIDQMGEKIPIIDLMVALAGLQWIVGPYIDYINNFDHEKYRMYVDEPTYMSYIVPAVLAFWGGTRLFRNNQSLYDVGERVNQLLISFPKLPYLLIVLGFVVPYLSGLFPSDFSFVFFLLANLKYIGVIYLLFSGSKNRWMVFVGTMVFTAITSIAAGMFHDLLLWAMLSFTFVAHELKMTTFQKILIAIAGMFLAITIQSVKQEYRAIVWDEGYAGNKTALFINLAAQQWRTGKVVTPTSDAEMNVRLNQGWIISSVMNHVPDYEPFAYGNTISEGITASLLPRIIYPEKKRAGGQENFRKYTGQDINEGTSMGISLAGEGYANFGKTGGIIFMFLWGVFISWFWKKLHDWSFYYPTALIWSPIIFLQVVKAETEFVVVLNHLIKASILVFGLLWFIKRAWGIRI